jgi:hypothetical protein
MIVGGRSTEQLGIQVKQVAILTPLSVLEFY